MIYLITRWLYGETAAMSYLRSPKLIEKNNIKL